MKKVLIYLLIISIGSAGVYYGLNKYNNREKQADNTNDSTKKDTTTDNSNNNDDSTIVPSRDAFISEAIKLQTLAENNDDNSSCKCYNVKDLDRNTSLSGSILVYTNDDLFISNMWLSNGYYLLDGADNANAGNLVESSDAASIYCGEESADVQSALCSTDN